MGAQTRSSSPLFTTVTAVDAKYLGRLRLSHPTWVANCRQVRESELIVFYDSEQVDSGVLYELVKNHPGGFGFLPARLKGVSQREKMLSAFVYGCEEIRPHLKTPYFLKLDADVICTKPVPDSHPGDLIEFDESGLPIYDAIASGWGYTKPASFVEECQKAWGRRFFDVDTGARSHVAKRFASWIGLFTFGANHTLASRFPKRLPCPSRRS